MRASDRRWDWPASGLLFVAAVGLGRWQGAARGTWTDEAATVFAVGRPWGELWRTVVYHDVNPPGSYFLFALWQRIGDSLFFLRSLSALFFGLSVVLTYHLGRRLLGRAAWLAAALFLLAPLSLFYAAQVRYPLPLTAVLLASTWALVDLAETGRKRAAVAWALSGAASFYVHYFAGFVLLAQGIFVLLAGRRLAARRRTWAAFVVLALLLLPWLPVWLHQLFGREAAGGGEPVPWKTLPPLVLVYLTQGFHFWRLPSFWRELIAPGFAALPLVAALPFSLLVALGLAPAGARDLRLLLVRCLTLIPLGSFLLVSLALNVFAPHYFLPFLPFLAIAAAGGVGWLWRKSRVFTVLATVSALTVAAGGAVELLHNPEVPEGWRPIAALIEDAAAEGDVVLLPNLAARLCYERHRRDALPVFHVTAATPGRQVVGPSAAEQTIGKLAARYRRAWYVAYYPGRFDPEAAAAAAVARRGGEIAAVTGQNDPRVRLELLYLRPPSSPGGLAPVIRFPAGPQHPAQLVAGWYPGEGEAWWTAGSALVLLPPPSPGARLHLEAQVPLSLFGDRSPAITARVDGRTLVPRIDQTGRLLLDEASFGDEPPFGDGPLEVELHCDRTFVPDDLFHDGDRRPKCLLVREIGWGP